MEINKSVKINIDAYNIFVLKFFFGKDDDRYKNI